LCPKSCGNCAAVLEGSTVVGGGGGSGCADRNIKIGGKNCYAARRAGYCPRDTNIGNIGRDLCPKSCGMCPPAPKFSSGGTYDNPTPARTRGKAGSSEAANAPAPGPSPSTTVTVTKAGAAPPVVCADDSKWKDKDGDGCAIYADFIAKGKLSQKQACSYGTAGARGHCKKTCGVCEPAQTEAPTTTAAPVTDAPTAEEKSEAAECQDRLWVTSWEESFGKRYKCSEFKDQYCGQDALFMQSCPKSCNLCSSTPQVCADDFKKESCEEWSALGFCDQPKVIRSCKKTCGLCSKMASARISDKETAGILSGPGTAEAEIVAEEGWEWGSRPALKKPAEKAEKLQEKRLRPALADQKSSAPGPMQQIIVALLACTLSWSL